MANPRLETTQTTTSTARRASLRKPARANCEQNGAAEAVTKRADGQTPRREGGRTVEDRVKRTSPNSAASATYSRASSGRQFTVGNIGNNGRIYLRPVTRPGNQRPHAPLTQAPFVFPPDPDTPPDSAGEELPAVHRQPSSSAERESLFSATFTTPPLKHVDSRRQARQQKGSQEEPIKPSRPNPLQAATKHSRSHSFSTVDNRNRPSVEHPGTFKVVIHRPSVSKPQHTSPGQVLNLLEVPIPSYRLGTPQFGAGGRAILRSSLYTRSSDKMGPRSSDASNAGYEKLLRSPSAMRNSLMSRRQSGAHSKPLFKRRSTTEELDPMASLPAPSEARYSIVAVASHLYDFLTLRPDDPTVVRYAPNSQTIVAATPSRLVAHITSPSFLDYELLSDFFLTFRSFLQPDELVSFLVSRLRWAVDRPDDFGRIVRVRTFVALRHWILNYFADDFLANLDLRKHFCELVNGVYEYLRNRSDGGAGDIKIIGELKKCWRRTVGLYWDNPDPFVRELADDDILPGGDLDAIMSDSALSIRAVTQTANDMRQAASVKVPNELAEAAPIIASSHKPFGAPHHAPNHAPKPSLSSEPISMRYSGRTGRTEQTATYDVSSSETSPKVISCSIPVKSTYKVGADVPLHPHPVKMVTPVLSPGSAPATARAPQSFYNQRLNRSFTDAIRDSHQFSEKSKGSDSDSEVPAMYIVPGSLVRGVLYQPDSPYFDVPAAASAKSVKTAMSVGFDEMAGKQGVHADSNAKKGFFGSMRKAFGQRHATAVDAGSDRTASPYDSAHSRTANSTPEFGNNGPQPKKSAQRLRNQVRVDLLAAMVAESFKEAVEAGMAEDRALEHDIISFTKDIDFARDGLRPIKPFDRSVTMGSRSIVIVDDTQPDLPMMSGAIRPPSEQQSGSTSEQYETYATGETNYRSQQKDTRRLDRDTGLSIDSVLLGQKTKNSQYPPRTASLLPPPAVYLPSGMKRSDSTKDATSRGPLSQVKRFTNSSETSTLRRFASYHSGDRKPSQENQERRKSDDSDQFILGKPPVRQLRRRPGGDLKAVDKVHDLHQRHRRNSTGSSIIDSIALPSRDLTAARTIATTTSDLTPKKRRRRVDESDGTRRKSISLIQTHSSQPNLRPSFEAEVAKLAALPDDLDDDGGRDAALLKLEGKYEKKTPSNSPIMQDFSPETPGKSTIGSGTDVRDGEDEEDMRHRHHKEHVEDVHPEHRLPSAPFLDVQTASIHHLSQSSGALSPRVRHIPAHSVVESDDSYSSIPLLQRGVSNLSPRRAGPALEHADTDPMKKAAAPSPGRSRVSSVEHVSETDSLKQVRLIANSDAHFRTMHESFLLDEDDGSDRNEYEPYDLESPSDHGSQGVRSFFDDEAVNDLDNNGAFMHPLRHPDTPPASRNMHAPQPVVSSNVTTWNQGLPTPGLTPVTKNVTQPISPISPLHHQFQQPPMDDSTARIAGLPFSKASQVIQTTAHLPFILAFDAEVLAQQFTIIEKDALDEIDWRELIELRWTQASPAIENWVHYLKSEDPRGVDLVIARFNIVVKWLLSEIVLTESQDERVRCIVQYIHIAEHCRKLRNFATMYQITIALLSAECSRLKKMWALVPEREMRIFEALEKVVQPIRNFQNLRKEMEVGVGDEGCIPFIGIYTRDLVYNSQKPAVIETPPLNANEPLVNFERHHTAATIVKSLLRLLEASSKYKFQIEPQIITKCLWMSALADKEISRLSRLLE